MGQILVVYVFGYFFIKLKTSFATKIRIGIAAGLGLFFLFGLIVSLMEELPDDFYVVATPCFIVITLLFVVRVIFDIKTVMTGDFKK